MKLTNRISSVKILSLAIMILLSSSIVIPAKSFLQVNNDAKINEMTTKLVKKLLLTKNQEKEVKNILTEYFKGLENLSGNGAMEEKVRKIADAKIEKLMDDKQKMKFDIIHDDWWALTKH
jgi:hypothetical protein